MSFPYTLKPFILQGQVVEIFVPDAGVVQESYKDGKISFPYWSKVWPAALALAEFLILYPEWTKERKVLELGAGLGLPSIVAAANAFSVLCTDKEPEAIEMAQRSAEYKRLNNFQTAVMDWNTVAADGKADVILLSDVNYEPSSFAGLQNLVEQFLQQGYTLLLSTPQRLVAKAFIEPLVAVSVFQKEIEVISEGSKWINTVLVLQKCFLVNVEQAD
jgi:predicted nicotinamide N-methyase